MNPHDRLTINTLRARLRLPETSTPDDALLVALRLESQLNEADPKAYRQLSAGARAIRRGSIKSDIESALTLAVLLEQCRP